MEQLSCKSKKFLKFLLTIWAFFVIAVVFWKGYHINYSPWWYIPKWCINLIPGKFFEIMQIWSEEGTLYFRKILPWVYNFAIYIIPGILLPLLFPQKRFFWILINCALFSVGVNAVRLFILRRGSFDVDDILLNLLGFSLGYLFLVLTRLFVEKFRRKGMQQ